MPIKLITVTNLTRKYPEALTEGKVRWHLFNARENGLEATGAIVRNGRRIFLDEDKYLSWLGVKGSSASQAA